MVFLGFDRHLRCDRLQYPCFSIENRARLRLLRHNFPIIKRGNHVFFTKDLPFAACCLLAAPRADAAKSETTR